MEDIDVESHEPTELKAQYKRKQIHFDEWVQIKRPGLNRQGAWLCNVDKNTMEDFMGHICQKKTEGGEYFAPPKFQSYNHVNGYESAILDFFDKQGLKEMCTDFIHGNKRNKRKDGEMKVTVQVSFEGYRFLAKKAIQQKTDIA